jgi:hypothetical protein
MQSVPQDFTLIRKTDCIKIMNIKTAPKVLLFVLGIEVKG